MSLRHEMPPTKQLDLQWLYSWSCYSTMLVDMTTRQLHLSNAAGESECARRPIEPLLLTQSEQRLHSEDDIQWRLDSLSNEDHCPGNRSPDRARCFRAARPSSRFVPRYSTPFTPGVPGARPPLPSWRGSFAEKQVGQRRRNVLRCCANSEHDRQHRYNSEL
jgi:hypothetical protein